jgi:hypothetical protein
MANLPGVKEIYFKIWFIRCNYRFEDDLGPIYLDN